MGDNGQLIEIGRDRSDWSLVEDLSFGPIALSQYSQYCSVLSLEHFGFEALSAGLDAKIRVFALKAVVGILSWPR
jgi:hypothetical protein